jgi:hypothetical protein
MKRDLPPRAVPPVEAGEDFAQAGEDPVNPQQRVGDFLQRRVHRCHRRQHLGGLHLYQPVPLFFGFQLLGAELGEHGLGLGPQRGRFGGADIPGLGPPPQQIGDAGADESGQDNGHPDQ